LANNDLGDERKIACHLGACLGLRHWLPKD
ncbi:MAG: hypothetical protein QOD93_2762, partial [Acetobacteraceae bacterium]|nr:hypothetical protein [Acetobacteraceae bacterium]